MIRDKIINKNDRCVNYYSSILQDCWRQEIEAAIEKVKREVPIVKSEPLRKIGDIGHLVDLRGLGKKEAAL